MTPAERNGYHLVLILEAVDDLERRLKDIELNQFLNDRDEQALTAFRLSIIGENANKLSDELKTRHPALPWPEMYAFRNVVSHEYHRIDPEQAWAAIENLEPIADMAREELARIEAEQRERDGGRRR